MKSKLLWQTQRSGVRTARKGRLRDPPIASPRVYNRPARRMKTDAT